MALTKARLLKYDFPVHGKFLAKKKQGNPKKQGKEDQGPPPCKVDARILHGVAKPGVVAKGSTQDAHYGAR